MKPILENIGAYIATATALVSLVIWLSSTNSTAKRTESDLKELEIELRGYEDSSHQDLSKIEERLARIEAQIDMMAEKVGFDIDYKVR